MNSTRFCNDWDPVQFDNFTSLNQKLAGVGSPKFNTTPYIAAPSHDLNAWKASDLTVHSHINQVTNYPEGDSGYAISSQFSNTVQQKCPGLPSENISSDIFTQTLQPGIYKRAKVTQPISSNVGISETPQFPTETFSTSLQHNYQLFSDYATEPLKESFMPSNTRPTLKRPPQKHFYSPLVPKQVKEGFHAQNHHFYSPSVPKQQHAMKKQPLKVENFYSRFLGPESVFDSRTTQGGGPGDASTWNYNSLLGRVDHKGYEFVNSVRQPYPIVRSNVDIYDWSLGIGMHDPIHMSSDHLHEQAHNQWLNDTNNFRASLSNSLMRKRNEEMVQLRQLPIRTF